MSTSRESFTSPSSLIRKVEHDAEEQRMWVTFRNGGKYNYHPVRVEQYEAFRDASSHGQHFNQNIRGQFNESVGN